MLNLKTLDENRIVEVLDLAKSLLATEGIEIESELVRSLLSEYGISIVNKPQRTHPVALIKEDIVERCIRTVPANIIMYDRFEEPAAVLGGNLTCFNPGSCGNHYYDPIGDIHRNADAYDLIDFTRIANSLSNIHMVSTSMVVSTVSPEIQDVYRLKLVLSNSTKPIVTGTFSDNFEAMKDMLVAVRGSEEALRKKPFAIFDCCPSPALKWPKTWSEDLIRCGKYGIPAEFISMPQPGLSAPPTLFDALVQHTAETLSGIVISQLANPGAPLIYGGSPTMINHRSMGVTPLLGDIGTMRLDTAYVAIAKHLDIPCQAYLGLSDSKRVDVQAGFEKGMSILLCALTGINNVSGPGMLESENCQCKEMLIIDNEVCGMALHFLSGVYPRTKSTIEDVSLMAEENVVDPDRVHYLRDPREFFSSEIADKEILQLWQQNDKKSMLDNAIDKAKEILASSSIAPLDSDVQKAIDDSCWRIMDGTRNKAQ